jgi:hypothetical protein
MSYQTIAELRLSMATLLLTAWIAKPWPSCTADNPTRFCARSGAVAPIQRRLSLPLARPFSARYGRAAPARGNEGTVFTVGTDGSNFKLLHGFSFLPHACNRVGYDRVAFRQIDID